MCWTTLGTTLQPPVQIDTKGAFCKVKRPECESDNSHKISVEIRKMWSYISTAPVFLQASVCLIGNEKIKQDYTQPYNNETLYNIHYCVQYIAYILHYCMIL
jgi:hypothetical protein